jgi:hypothetical protein
MVIVPSGDRFGAQASKWRSYVSIRDMDTAVSSRLVTFGPDAEPFTDFSVFQEIGYEAQGRGRVRLPFTSITGDGWQKIRVAGGVAAE